MLNYPFVFFLKFFIGVRDGIVLFQYSSLKYEVINNFPKKLRKKKEKNLKRKKAFTTP